MDSPPRPSKNKKRKTPSPVSPPALTSPALPIPTAQATRRRLQLPTADAPRRSARRDPAQVAALAAERASAEAAKRRDADARSVAVDARRECARVRRLPPVVFDAGGAPADPSKAPAGLACWPLAPGDLEELRRVHDHVKRSIDTPIPWAGGSDERDTRWRGYGLLGDGRTRLRRAIRFHSFETAGAAKRVEESDRNWASCVDYAPDAAAAAALARVAAAAARALPRPYDAEATYGNLVAVQPNVHAGARHLPCHLDWPRNDGFGVVIVTVAVKCAATVLLRDDGDDGAPPREWRVEVPEGHCYALSGDARNVCVHGLFCDDGNRESMNLRFGLHTQKRAKDEIYARWCTGDDAACGPNGPKYGP